MALITWNQALYTVNVPEFDEHHQQLVQYINDLHEAMMQGKGKEILTTLFYKLKDYTNYHFQAEEKWMVSKNYSGINEHKKIHEEFRQKLVEFDEKFKADYKAISIETFRFLKDWLVNHIQGTDKKYSTL